MGVGHFSGQDGSELASGRFSALAAALPKAGNRSPNRTGQMRECVGGQLRDVSGWSGSGGRGRSGSGGREGSDPGARESPTRAPGGQRRATTHGGGDCALPGRRASPPSPTVKPWVSSAHRCEAPRRPCQNPRAAALTACPTTMGTVVCLRAVACAASDGVGGAVIGSGCVSALFGALLHDLLY